MYEIVDKTVDSDSCIFSPDQMCWRKLFSEVFHARRRRKTFCWSSWQVFGEFRRRFLLQKHFFWTIPHFSAPRTWVQAFVNLFVLVVHIWWHDLTWPVLCCVVIATVPCGKCALLFHSEDEAKEHRVKAHRMEIFLFCTTSPKCFSLNPSASPAVTKSIHS